MSDPLTYPASVSELADDLRGSAQYFLNRAALPDFLPWSPTMKVRKRLRSLGCLGKFEVYVVKQANRTWKIDAKYGQEIVATETGVSILWKIEVETHGGTVTATPFLRGNSDIVSAGFSMTKRTLGSVGPIEPLFLSRELLHRFNLPNVHVRQSEAKRIRAELLGDRPEELLGRLLTQLDTYRP